MREGVGTGRGRKREHVNKDQAQDDARARRFPTTAATEPNKKKKRGGHLRLGGLIRSAARQVASRIINHPRQLPTTASSGACVLRRGRRAALVGTGAAR
jgi:hypothetical protein